jgi:pSer/pThr/pTyr-binding forkhead associated (FHA) protein
MTNLPAAGLAWLEDANRERFQIRGSWSIGRSASNQVALASDKVSRRALRSG